MASIPSLVPRKVKQKMLNQFRDEKDIIDWSVNLQKIGRKGRFEELTKKKLI
tara:strand:+ start:414 stop:569 length:156 start_codon:yes stop_codon:yes gene_type:complete